ncbi:hypothetical protein VTL71DRAFT_15437 [Oculimacula yallundae]|uniref:Transcription factor domain-containing protein n=1 Tax=Oculimacula yallundae TaxID=86028 RepID=A0ABR4CGL5_9HELO
MELLYEQDEFGMVSNDKFSNSISGLSHHHQPTRTQNGHRTFPSPYSDRHASQNLEDSLLRCSRLNKECLVLPRVTRKRRSPNTASNTAALEQKIESLVSLLSSTQAAGVPIRSSHLTPPESLGLSEPSPPADCQNDQQDEDFPSVERRWVDGPRGDIRHSTWIPPPGGGNTVSTQIYVGGHELFPPILDRSGNEISCINGQGQAQSQAPAPAVQQDANALLHLFREDFLPRFPFIVIPNGMSADTLRSQKPWLYKAVMTAAFQQDRVMQIEMSKQFLMDISAAMLLRGEKSLDMLQGLIVYNAWSYYYSPVIPSWQSTGIHQLSIALLFDLGLTRPVRDNEGPLSDVSRATGQKDEHERTLDERRALLCCYFLTSVSAFCLKKMEGLRYSAYIEHCCEVLFTGAVHESDVLLASLCKLQNIIEPVYRAFADKAKVDNNKAPVWMLVKLVRAEMENFWKCLPATTQQDQNMLMSYNSAEVFTYEPSIYAPFFRTSTTPGSTSPQRMDMLYGCLISSQKLLNGYINQPHQAYKGLSVIDLSHIGRGLSTLLKLSLVEEVGWDLAHVRQTVNLSFYFDGLVERFERVGEVVDGMQKRTPRDRANSFPTGCARAMRMVQHWYEAKIAAEAAPSSQHAMNEPSTVPSPGMEDVMLDDTFDYMNDANWLDLMGDFNFNLPV